MADSKYDNVDIDDLLGLTSDDDKAPEPVAPTPAPKPVVVRRTKKVAAPVVVADDVDDVDAVDALDAPVEISNSSSAPAETADEARIRELEARIAALDAIPAEEPVELTAAQKKIAELEARLAVAEVEKAPVKYEAATGQTILIHFLEDGFTAQGQIWYRGQELEFTVGGQAHEQTKNRDGVSWLDADVDTQYSRYGKEMFRVGPWRGKGWDTAVAEVAEADISKSAAAERKRARAVPLIN